MKKIKIAFFADVLIRNYDGAIRTMYHIIDRLPSDKFEIKFFCGDPPKHDFPHSVVKIANFTLPINKTYKMAVPQVDKLRLERALNKFGPDVIHTSTPSMLGYYALGYANRKGIPVTSIYHTHFISYVDYYLKKTPQFIPRVKKFIENRLVGFYNRCDKVFVPTYEMIDFLGDIGIDNEKMSLWQRGIDRNIFSTKRKDLNYIRQLVRNDKPNLLFASRVVWEKNLEILVKLYNKFEASGRNCNFIIAGDGVAKEALMGMMPNAIFTGSLSQLKLATLYASSEVFVFPSISETYGNVVTEAMACGLPCVIADGGGSKSFIRHGYNGFLCKHDEPQDYFNRISFLLDNKNMLTFFKVNGLNYVRSMCWEKLVKDFYLQLEKLVGLHTKELNNAA